METLYDGSGAFTTSPARKCPLLIKIIIYAMYCMGQILAFLGPPTSSSCKNVSDPFAFDATGKK